MKNFRVLLGRVLAIKASERNPHLDLIFAPLAGVVLMIIIALGFVDNAHADEEVYKHTCQWIETPKGIIGAEPSGCYPLGEPKAVYTDEERVEIASPLACPQAQTDEGKILSGFKHVFTRKIYTVTRFCRTMHG